MKLNDLFAMYLAQVAGRLGRPISAALKREIELAWNAGYDAARLSRTSKGVE